ncbi:MAG: tetratricopeptide repeat protein [Deltaproteobacteria bacterium]|jgi:tetratricopeptide (TPR) repeat protein|nr:tetratricopeptide repeat protein [Deltaproteobacteria bacterium]
MSLSDNYYHVADGTSGGWKNFLRLGVYLLSAVALVSLISLLVWNFVAPESLAKVYGSFFGRPLEIYSLELTLGRQALSIKPDTAAEVNPHIPVRLEALETNRWRNYDLRLYSPDIEIDLLTKEAKSILELKGEAFFEKSYPIIIQAREGEAVRASFTLNSFFNASDWASRGDAAVEVQKKIGYYRRALELDRGSPLLTQKLSQALELGGLYRELTELLEDDLSRPRSDTERYEHLVKLLNLYRKLKNVEQEIGTLERLIAEPLTNEQARVFKANLAVLYRTSKPLKAAKFYEELLEGADEESKLSFLLELVSIYNQTEQDQPAIAVLNKLIESASPDRLPALWSEMLRLKIKVGDSEGQFEAWSGLAASLPKGLEKVNAYKRLAYLLYQEKQYQRAAEAYKAAIDLDDTDPHLFLNLARLSLQMGDRNSYRKNLENSLALKDDALLTIELAVAYEKDGLKWQAIQTLQKLIDNEIDDPKIASIKNEAKVRQLNLLRPPDGQYSQAFEQKLYQFSNNYLEFFNLGVAHFKAKRWELALKAFQKAYELDIEKTLTIDLRAYLLNVYKEKGQYKNMVEQAMLIYQQDGARKDCRDLIIGQLERERNWTGLVKAVSQWIEWHPGEADNYRFLALAQKNAGQAKEASHSLMRAAELEPDKASSWFTAAESLKKVGDQQAAKRAYEMVLKLEPANEKAEAALLRLALDSLDRTKTIN